MAGLYVITMGGTLVITEHTVPAYSPPRPYITSAASHACQCLSLPLLMCHCGPVWTTDLRSVVWTQSQALRGEARWLTGGVAWFKGDVCMLFYAILSFCVCVRTAGLGGCL